MIESASQTLARSVLATSWPQGLSSDASRPAAETQTVASDPARAAQTPPSLSFSATLATLTHTSLGSGPIPESDAGSSSRHSPDREPSSSGQGRAAYAAAARGTGTSGSGPGLDMRV
jgi:hypothetical protein